MSDFAVPNTNPGPCGKCNGTGKYRWRRPAGRELIELEGPCYSCGGSGRQELTDILRNQAYNRHKAARMGI